MNDSGSFYDDNNGSFFDEPVYGNNLLSVNRMRIFIAILLVVVFAICIIFVIFFGKSFQKSNYYLSVDGPDLIYIGESASISATTKGKENLDKINTIFEPTNEYNLFALNDTVSGNNVTNTIVPIQEGIGGIEVFSAFANTKNVRKNALSLERLNFTICPKFDSSLLLSNQLSVVKGTTYKLDVDFGLDECSKNVEYKSQNTNIMTVGNDGTIKGVGIGTTNLVVSKGDRSFTVPVIITKNVVKINSLVVNYSVLQLIPGDRIRLDISQMPANSTSINVKCTSSDTNVATVTNSGLIEAKAPGVATINVLYGDLTKTVKIVVNDIGLKQEIATDIVVNKSEVILNKGQSEKIFTIVTPDGAINRFSDWSSSNTDVAIVDYNGVIYANDVGSADITVTNGNVSKSIKVIVTE